MKQLVRTCFTELHIKVQSVLKGFDYWADVKSTYNRIKNNSFEIPENVELEGSTRELIHVLLQGDPSKRPSLQALRRHPLLVSAEHVLRSQGYCNRYTATVGGQKTATDLHTNNGKETKEQSKNCKELPPAQSEPIPKANNSTRNAVTRPTSDKSQSNSLCAPATPPIVDAARPMPVSICSSASVQSVQCMASSGSPPRVSARTCHMASSTVGPGTCLTLKEADVGSEGRRTATSNRDESSPSQESATNAQETEVIVRTPVSELKTPSYSSPSPDEECKRDSQEEVNHGDARPAFNERMLGNSSRSETESGTQRQKPMADVVLPASVQCHVPLMAVALDSKDIQIPSGSSRLKPQQVPINTLQSTTDNIKDFQDDLAHSTKGVSSKPLADITNQDKEMKPVRRLLSVPRKAATDNVAMETENSLKDVFTAPSQTQSTKQQNPYFKSSSSTGGRSPTTSTSRAATWRDRAGKEDGADIQEETKSRDVIVYRSPSADLATCEEHGQQASLHSLPQPSTIGDRVGYVLPSMDARSREAGDASSVWVRKWVDYSNKYGLGYQLSDGSVGVLFNDHSKIILSPCKRTYSYLERYGFYV